MSIGTLAHFGINKMRVYSKQFGCFDSGFVILLTLIEMHAANHHSVFGTGST